MDRMIVAIALADSENIFLCADNGQINFDRGAGLKVNSNWDLHISVEHSPQNLSERDTGPWPEQRKPPKLTGYETRQSRWRGREWGKFRPEAKVDSAPAGEARSKRRPFKNEKRRQSSKRTGALPQIRRLLYR